MSTKNVYFYKLTLIQEKDKKEIENIKSIIEDIINANSKNNSINLYSPGTEPIIMDILEQKDEYLFARLSKKRRNNSIQKRDYGTLMTSPVLNSMEVTNNGVETFTYCIIGYKHGILSIARNQSAPGESVIKRLFALYKNEYNLIIDSVPNNKLIDEIYNSDNAIINRITFEIPTPNAQLLQESLHVEDSELIELVQQKTHAVSIEIKPANRSHIINDSSFIKKLIDSFKSNNNKNFSKVVISGKPSEDTKQKRYDLFEEYFKYPIEINETHTEGGRKVEYPKEKIQNDYCFQMMNIYDSYKTYILGICDRL